MAPSCFKIPTSAVILIVFLQGVDRISWECLLNAISLHHPPNVESLGVGLRNMQLNEHIQALRTPF